MAQPVHDTYDNESLASHKGFANQFRKINKLESVFWSIQSTNPNLIEVLFPNMETEIRETKYCRFNETEVL